MVGIDDPAKRAITDIRVQITPKADWESEIEKLKENLVRYNRNKRAFNR